jgi:hypothetical protein
MPLKSRRRPYEAQTARELSGIPDTPLASHRKPLRRLVALIPLPLTDTDPLSCTGPTELLRTTSAETNRLQRRPALPALIAGTPRPRSHLHSGQQYLGVPIGETEIDPGGSRPYHDQKRGPQVPPKGVPTTQTQFRRPCHHGQIVKVWANKRCR